MNSPDELHTRIADFDQWVTSLVDLIPTSIYIQTDITRKESTEKLSNAEKRKRRLDPDQCLTTSMKALMNMEPDSDESDGDDSDMDDSSERNGVRPSDLKEKYAAKMKEIRNKREGEREKPRVPRTEEEQLVVSQKRKEERNRKKLKKTKVKTIIDFEKNQLINSPVKEPVENGKVIFNKFDLIKDPIEAEKERLKKKKPLQVRVKEAESREAKLDELDEENPEKADELREKKKWKDAITRVKGDKVRDDAGLLKKSLKRQMQKKAASQKKWGARTDKIKESMKAKQDTRKKNLKGRGKKVSSKDKKKAASAGKKTPGF